MKRFTKHALLLLVLALAAPGQTACCAAGSCGSLGIGEVLGDAMIESVSRSAREESRDAGSAAPSAGPEEPEAIGDR